MRLQRWLSAVCEWIMRLAAANVVWLGLVLLGAGVGGFFPATAALFALARRWRLGCDDRVPIAGADRVPIPGDDGEPTTREDRVPIAGTMWSSYRAEFVRANALGYALAVVGYLLYLDLRLMADSAPLLVLSLIAGGVYVVMLLHIWPVFVHLDEPWHQQIRIATLLGLAHPVRTLHLLVVIAGVYLVCFQFPGLVVFFGGSVVATFATWQTLAALDHHAKVSGARPAATTAPSTARLSPSPLR